MKIVEMSVNDIMKVVPLYIQYFNTKEGASWNEAKASKRIHQILSMEDSYGLIMIDDQNNALGFCMGFFRQQDDSLEFILDQIVINVKYQNRQLGSLLMYILEQRVLAKGANAIELISTSSEKHNKFFSKHGYINMEENVSKGKIIHQELNIN